MSEPIVAELKERFLVNAAQIEKLKEQSIAFEIELFGIMWRSIKERLLN